MDTQIYFKILSAILGSACFLPYINAIIRKEAKPMKATWLIWTSLDTITFWGMVVEDSLDGQMAATIVGVWIIFFLSLKYGVPGWTKLDMFCLATCFASILLWKIFESPVLGILISSVANCVGALPTMFSAYTDSRRENKLAWVLGTAASCCALASIPEWKLAHYAQPIAFLIIQAPMLYLLFIRAAVPIEQEQVA